MKTIHLGEIKQGDYWAGVQLITYAINGEPVDITGAVIRMHLRKRHDSPGEPLLSWSTEDSTINIVDAEAGEFAILGRTMTIEPGTYASDVEVAIDAKPLTVLDFSWTITKSATR